ncbi:hypothetical protein EB796_020313 [Bugula neritina]|uniref:Uncharacterized protein n=1 Tax=Bugula neritina TaxID=10212 RepID=A0A7J7J5A4_BUGNE|nr:hypothetical protein EB796_020313 [Bugula neritina]
MICRPKVNSGGYVGSRTPHPSPSNGRYSLPRRNNRKGNRSRRRNRNRNIIRGKIPKAESAVEKVKVAALPDQPKSSRKHSGGLLGNLFNRFNVKDLVDAIGSLEKSGSGSRDKSSDKSRSHEKIYFDYYDPHGFYGHNSYGSHASYEFSHHHSYGASKSSGKSSESSPEGSSERSFEGVIRGIIRGVI